MFHGLSTPLPILERDVDWLTLRSVCPACGGLVRLVADAYMATRPTSPTPHARIAQHDNEWGKECLMTHRAAPAWDERTTRAAVHGRSGGVCEFCQRQRATDMHHRISVGVGGKWCPANIIHLCRGCHSKCTMYRDWGYLVGLIVLSHEDPAAKAVERPSGELLWLTDEVCGGLNDPHRERGRRRRS